MTYLYCQNGTFPYGLIANATANAPVDWVFDHWTAEGNITISSTTDNPTTVTVICGGNLTAVFVEEYGNGDFGTIGYWKHVFYVWSTSKGTFKDYTGQILEWYLGNITETSTVFGENYILTLESAYELLWSHNSSMYTRALKQCLACWLNWANGVVTMSEMVDTDYDGVPDDMTFGDAMAIVEGILTDPNSSRDQLDNAKDICDSINNSGNRACNHNPLWDHEKNPLFYSNPSFSNLYKVSAKFCLQSMRLFEFKPSLLTESSRRKKVAIAGL